MAYKYYNPNKRYKNDRGDCVIRAISKAMNQSWDKTYVELCLEGYLMGDWGDSNQVWDSYLRGCGFKRKVIPNTCPDCYTVAEFAYDNPYATYARYVVDVGGNIAVSTGGTPGEISMALAIDGEPIPTSTMTVTPAAVGEFFNIHSSIEIAVPSGCCYVVALENISTQSIDVQNLNIRFTRVA